MTKHLRVNPIACDAHGLCAELFPERITVDDWGYPIVGSAPIPRNLEDHAKRAVAACPALALALVETPEPHATVRNRSGRYSAAGARRRGAR
jgi:ferredoxin